MCLKGIALVVLFISISHAFPTDSLLAEEWQAFKLGYGKVYESPEEEWFRSQIFGDNKMYIAKHNQLYAKGKVSFELALNEFADLLETEFFELMNGFNATGSELMVREGANFVPPAHVTLPQSVDWRTRGAVSGVKNQGRCGSCWAFASTGSLEGQHYRKTRALISLSEQNLIDCSRNYGNNGCHGGFMTNAYQYIKDNRGIDTERGYPYEARDNVCRFDRNKVGSTDRGYSIIRRGDENHLMSAVASIGPISVAIDADHRSFQFYSRGVYNEPACNANHITHAVLIVGYGSEGNHNYWLVKNSWGTGWGDRGYIKMSRNRGNQCGIASFANYPLV